MAVYGTFVAVYGTFDIEYFVKEPAWRQVAVYGTLVAVYGTFDIEYFKDLARTSGSVRDVCGSVRDVLSLRI